MEEQIFKLINESSSICLLTHESPDGDAIGSVLAFYNYLVSINKVVDIVVEDAPSIYSFVNGYDKIKNSSNSLYDLGIILDCSSAERVSVGGQVLNKCTKLINIDHHITNKDFGDVNYVLSESPSCTQIIYFLFKNNNINVNKEIGTALMVGLLTDTCGFRNNNVNKESYLMAADLFNLVDIYSVYDITLFKKSKEQFELSQVATERLQLLYDNKIAFTYLLEEDFKKVHAKIGDHEGIVDIGRSIDGIEVSAFIREEKGTFKVSLRSTGRINVNRIAEKFNGGGHSMAAGCTICNNFKETKDLLIAEIIKEISQ